MCVCVVSLNTEITKDDCVDHYDYSTFYFCALPSTASVNISSPLPGQTKANLFLKI